MSDGSFPVAEVVAAKTSSSVLSRMWLLTLVCLLIAIGLTWYSLDAPGQPIVIRFVEGYGIKPGDALQHRGIRIGEVESVSLRQDLSGIEVHAVLDAHASAIAREGTRFWIVRPQLDLTGVSGLDTAVGAKYIAVVPGDGNRPQYEFDGLSARPPEGLDRGGIEITLRGDQRFGVNPGSPLTWRGIEVGHVLSSGLSPDALHVDTRVRIDESHRRLLARNSKFWVTSGVHVGVRMSGVEISAESLATIVRGGIAFITPSPLVAGEEVQPGDVFMLYEHPMDDWIESAAAVPLLRRETPPVTELVATWKEKFVGITRSQTTAASALVIARETGSPTLVFPRDLIEPHQRAVQDSFQLTYRSEPPIAIDWSAAQDGASLLAEVPTETATVPAKLLAADRLRTLERAEDCFAIIRRRSPDQDTVLIEMIGRDQLHRDADGWEYIGSRFSRDAWHGAVVVASSDEKVIGMLVVGDQAVRVVPLR